MAGVRIDMAELLREADAHASRGYAAHVNPRFMSLVRTLGYDHRYVRGEGAHLFDADGARYLDCIAGYAVHSVGRAHPTVVAALQDILASGRPSMVQFEANGLAALLAKDLVHRMPSDLPFAFFSNSGTEAVECALKLARRFTGRAGVLHCDKAFHGLTLGALAANGNANLREPFGPLGESECIPLNDLAALERALSSKRFAAFIIEPVQGKTCLAVDAGYLGEATRLCRMHGTLLVVDEAQTGVGRTGKFLALEHDPACAPDMVVLSKALSGGYVPIGVTLVRSDVWHATFTSMANALIHSSTFHEGTLAMVAAIAVLRVYDSERLGARAERLGAVLKSRLAEVAERHRVITEVRSTGLMTGVILEKGAAERMIASLPTIGVLEELVFGQAFAMHLLRDHRILCQVTDRGSPILKFTPALVADDADMDWLVNALDATCSALGGGVRAFTHGLASAAVNQLRR